MKIRHIDIDSYVTAYKAFLYVLFGDQVILGDQSKMQYVEFFQALFHFDGDMSLG